MVKRLLKKLNQRYPTTGDKRHHIILNDEEELAINVYLRNSMGTIPIDDTMDFDYDQWEVLDKMYDLQFEYDQINEDVFIKKCQDQFPELQCSLIGTNVNNYSLLIMDKDTKLVELELTREAFTEDGVLGILEICKDIIKKRTNV